MELQLDQTFHSNVLIITTVKLIFRIIVWALIMNLSFLMACYITPENKILVKVQNTINIERNGELVAVNISTIKNLLKDVDITKLIVETDTVIPFQFTDTNNDKMPDQLIFEINLKAGEQKMVTIRSLADQEQLPEFTKRTQAELSIKNGGTWEWVTKKNGNEQYEYKGGTFKNINYLKVPEQHTDHSFYIRYEGPGWESDKLGYRLYLDWRNAVDLFGKKVDTMVLQGVGQDGFESYHSECPWGMDILKVGNSLGIGTIAFWDGQEAQRIAKTDSVECSIVENGVLQSLIQTNYYGWDYDKESKTDLTSKISINAGSRLTFQQIFLSSPVENICTGIVKLKGGRLYSTKTSDKNWGYIASFGDQSLNNDNMGMVIFYKNRQRIKITNDTLSHVIVLKPEGKSLSYFYAATWEQDPDHIADSNQFLNYVNTTLMRLNNPVSIDVDL